MAKKLILFDLDGVIIDSKSNMEFSWQKTCEKFNIQIPFNNYFELIGRPFKDILEILEINSLQNDIEITFNKISSENMSMISFYDQAVSVLQKIKLKGDSIGIVTSKHHLKTKKILNQISVNFDVIETPNENLCGKPAPDHLFNAMKILEIDAEDTIYIGDTQVDYESAKSANIKYFHALWGYGSCSDKSIIKLKKISDLIDFI